MRVSSPSDQALIQAQLRLEMQGPRAAAGDGDPQAGRGALPEVRVYEGEYVPGEPGRAAGHQTYNFARHGVYDAGVGTGQPETGAQRGTPSGVLRYLEQQPAEPETASAGRGRLGQHLDLYV